MRNPLGKIKNSPLRRYWLVYGAVCLFAFFLFAHPDIIETANHSYLLLQGIFEGRFLHFYEDVMAHSNGFYYINNAHYNIVVYLIFALAQLPVFLFNTLFGTPVSEPVLYFTGKLVSAGFFAGCVVVLGRIVAQLGLGPAEGRAARLFLALFPPAFFAVFVMGQYDSICLFFLLLGFWYWQQGRLWRCAIWFGVGAACKFFPLLLLVPLVLLRKKRPLHILKYGLASLWLVVPTGLLFAGRTGDMPLFNSLMAQRLLHAKLPAGGQLPIFPLLYFMLCFAAYLWRPALKHTQRTGLWLCLAVLGTLFVFVDWHPQWVILIAPFLVLTTLLEKQRTPWYWLDILLSAGFFVHMFAAHPYQLEANLVDFGLVGLATGLVTTGAQVYNSVLFYLQLFGPLPQFGLVLFSGALAAHVLLKWPGAAGTPAARLANGAHGPAEKLLPRWAFFVFVLGMAVWVVPTLFTWLKCMRIL